MSGEEKNKLPSILDDAGSLQDSLMDDIMETFLPRILPKLEPAFKKLSEFLNKEGDKKWIILQTNPKDGSLHLMILKTKLLESFKVSDKEDSDGNPKAYKMYPINEFLEVLMQGDMDTIMDKVKEETDKL